MNQLKPEDRKVAVMQVIVTNLTVRGSGDELNPTRIVRQFWTMDGEMLAEVDLSIAGPWT